MENLFLTVADLLKSDERFFTAEGKLIRNALYEAAMKMDASLIKVLLGNEDTRKQFFSEVDIDGKTTYVFDKIEFGWFVNNKEFLPDSYTRYKNKIGLADKNGEMISSRNDVEIVFPYKDCVLEGGQSIENERKNEVFYNVKLSPNSIDRLLEPKIFTNAVKFTYKGSEEKLSKFDRNSNLIIKGNNLLAIKSLLRKYNNKIDCIYIDPPYNPQSNANTFAYNNSFNRSTWLTFMKNRLEVAKKLLAPKGVLIVAIDKNEQPRLQILIEEIFPEYDVDCITVVHNPRGTIGTNFSYTHEYAIFVTPRGIKTIADRIVGDDEIDWSPLRNWGSESLRTDAKNCFYPIIVKNEKIIGFGEVCADSFHPKSQTESINGEYYVYPIDKNGIERKWRYAKQTVPKIKDLLRVKKTKNGYDIELGKNFEVRKTVWIDSKYDASTNGSQLLKKIVPNTVFSYPKSLYNVIDCIESVVRDNKNAIILDFFAGSGTTGHAVMDINQQDDGCRKFILVEQMSYVKTDTLVRNINVMRDLKLNTSIIYCELAQLNQKFVDELQNADTDEKVKDILVRLLKSGFISDRVDPRLIDVNAPDFNALTLAEKKDFVMQVLDANMLYVNYSDIDDEEFKISEEDKAFTKSFYGEE